MKARLCIAGLLALLVCAGAAKAARQPANGPDPAVAEWPEWPHPVSCGGPLRFDPVVAFSGPTDAERGTLPSERALARFLQKGELDWVRRHDWRLLAASGGFAEFTAGRLSSEPEWKESAELEAMTFQRIHHRWKWQGYSSNCTVRSIRRGLSAITWTLARGQHLDPSTQQIKVDLGPGECNDGKSQNKRVQKPEFREQNGRLLLSLWLRPVSPGGHTCVGLIEPPLSVALPEPLGERELLDGGTYPPQSVQPPR